MLDHYVLQFLTGHGTSRAKLNGFLLVDSPECGWCDVDGTVEHMLWECRRVEEKRREFPEEVVVEDMTLGLWYVMENGCRRAKLFQMMKLIGRRK